MTRVGLFGGSFDPIHLGHLAVAACARAQAELSEVLFIPTRISPLKQTLPPAPDFDRWTMVVLATLDQPYYRAVRWDLEREGPSYTVETLRIARAELGAETEFTWIIGADNLLTLPRWRDVEGILDQATLLVVPREGLEGAELLRAKEALPEAYQPRIALLDMEPVKVSSTEVRARLNAGMPVEGLLPRLTMAYIERYNLFRPAES
ncbi:Nicotinate-nucleotide adenylyltransferase [compost metagenome]